MTAEQLKTFKALVDQVGGDAAAMQEFIDQICKTMSDWASRAKVGFSLEIPTHAHKRKKDDTYKTREISSEDELRSDEVPSGYQIIVGTKNKEGKSVYIKPFSRRNDEGYYGFSFHGHTPVNDTWEERKIFFLQNLETFLTAWYDYLVKRSASVAFGKQAAEEATKVLGSFAPKMEGFINGT